MRAVISDNPLTSAQSATVSKLEAAKIPVVKVGKPHVHAKVFVVDGTSLSGPASSPATASERNLTERDASRTAGRSGADRQAT